VLPPIYLDECIDRRLADNLSSDGIDILTVADAETISDDDEAQLTFSTSQGRLIMTQNQIDVRRLHA